MLKETGRRRKLWKLVLGLGLTLVIALIAGVNVYHNRQGVQIPVRVEPVQVLELENTVLATGTVHPVEQQEIYAVGAVVVAEVLVREGDRVKAGQVLGRLDDKDFRKEFQDAEALHLTRKASLAEATGPQPEELALEESQVRQAELQVEAARKELERVRYLYEQEAAAAVELEKAEQELAQREAELESARARLDKLQAGPPDAEREALAAQVEQARAALEIARDRVARATLRAAMDGVVYKLEAKAGQPVAANASLISIVNPDRLEVQAEINEADAGLVEVGQQVRVKSIALPGETFEGEVNRIGAGAATRTGPHGEQSIVPVVIALNDTGGRLRPGYNVDLEIVVVEKRDLLVVPYEAVTEQEGATQAFVVAGDRVEQRELQIAEGNELYEEVVSGLKEGEKVVVGPPDYLKDGDRVRIAPGGPPGLKQ